MVEVLPSLFETTDKNKKFAEGKDKDSKILTDKFNKEIYDCKFEPFYEAVTTFKL